jgi:hypothetical protein
VGPGLEPQVARGRPSRPGSPCFILSRFVTVRRRRPLGTEMATFVATSRSPFERRTETSGHLAELEAKAKQDPHG